MSQVDIRRALDMLPRFNGQGARARWCVDGRLIQTNARIIPVNVDRVMRMLMKAVSGRGWRSVVQMVDVSGDNLYVLHRAVKAKHLIWMFKRNWSWQNWKRYRLPIYLRHNGNLIIWNGTHRMTLARLANRKVRARVFDLDKFCEWCKDNPLKNHFVKRGGKIIKLFKNKRDAEVYAKWLNKERAKKIAAARRKKARKRGHK